MALDDKIFQSAIARINRVKSKPTIPQVLVFEDPPHLKKLNKSQQSDDTTSDSTNDKKSAILQPSDGSYETTLHKDLVLNTSNNDDTKKGTKSGTNKGTQKCYQQNRVHEDSTIIGTKGGTNRSTKKATNALTNTDFDIPITPSFIYQRPYDALSGIPKKIVDIIFELCRKYGGRETPPVPFAMIVRLCNEKKNSIKVARQRLLDEGIIITENPSNTPAKGRSGMLIYKLRDDLFEEINDGLSLFVRKYDQPEKKGTKYNTNKGTGYSSSSSNNIKTTTTDLPLELKLNYFFPL